MKFTSILRVSAQAFVSSALLLVCAAGAHATDTYDLSTRQLTMPTLDVGSATLSNVVVTVAIIVSLPTGTSGNGAVDSYDPATGYLTVQCIDVAGIAYYYVIVTVGPGVSIGSATGVDSYSGVQLTIPAVQVGNTIYTDVVVNVGLANIDRVAGGMPAGVLDTYDLSTGMVSIPAVSAFGSVYTNVTLKNVSPSDVVSIGGQHAATTGVL